MYINLHKIQCENRRRGFSLIELIVYISVMALIMIVIINMMTVIITTQQRVKNMRTIEHSAVVTLDRFIREVRSAVSVVTGQSQFDTHPGVLVLNSLDESGDPIVVEFSLNNQELIIESDEMSGPLSDPEARVTNLIFSYSVDDNKEFIRIQLEIESGQGQSFRTETFYTGALVRDF